MENLNEKRRREIRGESSLNAKETPEVNETLEEDYDIKEPEGNLDIDLHLNGEEKNE